MPRVSATKPALVKEEAPPIEKAAAEPKKRTARNRDGEARASTKPTEAKPEAAKNTPAKSTSTKSSPPKATGTKSGGRLITAEPEPAPPPPPLLSWRTIVHELSDQFTQDLFGLLSLLLGAFFLLSVLGSNLAWIERIAGWSALPSAVVLVGLGAVLMTQNKRSGRLGYWSAEALLGVELTLIALQAGTYVMNNENARWPVLEDGSNGGVVGWALGSLLIAGLGRWPALLFLLLCGGMGLLFLLRYTPLVYVSERISRTLPLVRGGWLRLSDWFSTWLPNDLGNDPDDDSSNGEGSDFVRAGASRASFDFRPRATENFVSPAANLPETGDDRLADDDVEISWDKAAPLKAKPVGKRNTNPLFGNLANHEPPAATKGENAQLPPIPVPTTKPPPPPKPVRTPDQLPAVDFLKVDEGKSMTTDVRALQTLIESTLDDFDVPVKVVHVESGPTVTQFGVEPLYIERAGQRRKVRVNRIVNLADDLALALAAQSVRIEAPVPGRPYVGIEVPNTEKTMVGLRGILESSVMRKEGGHLGLPLGRNTAGAPVVMDMARAPHLLIAGSTGSGKSVCVNTIITGLLMQHGPETLRFVMVDPKTVELSGYNGIPHLLGQVIVENDQVMGALTWLLLQMDDRYRLFREVGVRNLLSYNELARKQRKGETKLTPLPYIILIIDELADLMMTAADDIEKQICRLAQMARATGIHLIIATQRPSVDVVTGLIKANFPSRIAFAVTSQTDSRVILDTPGAERLLGRGDMLLMRGDSPILQRVQGCYVHDDEINRVIQYWKEQPIEQGMPTVPPWNSLLDKLEDKEELIQDAIALLQGMKGSGSKTISTSMLQRKLQLGYPRAAKLMEELANHGIVGPDMGGGRGRELLLKTEEMMETSP